MKIPTSGGLLVSSKLELGPAEGLSHMLLVLQLGADGHRDLANVDPDHRALGLSRGTTHTCLEPVSSSRGQHLIEDDVEWWSCTWMWKPPLPQLFTTFCTCWHKYGKSPGLQKRAAHTHLTPCGHRWGTHPVLPSSMPHPRCTSQHQGHLGGNETLGTACSYNTGNTGRGSGQWWHQDLQRCAKGRVTDFWCGPFLKSLFVTYNITSVLCFCFLAMRHAGS